MRFTIRDLMWAMVVVALATAWWIDSARTRATLVRQQAQMRDLEEAVAFHREQNKVLRVRLFQAQTGRSDLSSDQKLALPD
jgi:hypothetical protein